MTENVDQIDPSTPAPESDPAPKKPNKWLTMAFNMASGAAVSMAIKATVVACATPFLSPVVTIGVAAAAAGIASSYARHYFENRRLKKDGQEPVKFTFKKAAMGAGFGLLGAGLAAGLSELFSHFFGGAPVPACPPEAPVDVQPAAGPAPVVEAVVEPECPPTAEAGAEAIPCPPPAPIDCVKQLAENHAVSDRVHDAIERVAATSPKASAQGLKDLGFFLYNGLDGMPKDPCLAVKLLQEAADLGNVQAKVDLAFIEYHGNAAAGIAANPEAALEKMQGINTSAARQFVEQWTGTDLTEDSFVEAAKPEAPAAIATPAPVETVTLTPSAPVVTVDVTNPSAPVAFESAANVAATVESGLASGNSMDCQPIINVGGNNEIDFVCSVPANDDNFNVGDRVIIQRPGLLDLVR